MTTQALLFKPKQRFDTALLLLRVAIGVIFVAHGVQKLLVYTLPGTAGAFADMGVPLPSLSAYLITFLELFGGAALILGLFTRVAATLLALDMLGAILLVHVPAGFFNPHGVEFPLSLFAASLALALTGGGGYALDSFVSRRASTGNALTRRDTHDTPA